MPEYLSPGVYVEEVSTGSKPIEGVSTSTAGMVGITERGPENIPVLVTSYGEYRRVYGGELRLADFTDATGRVHGYLPHSVQGFFQNDGRRDYVVRVVPDDADRASRFLFDRGDATSADTVLLRMAPQDSGTAVNQPLLYVLDVGSMTNGDRLRIGVGSHSEYHEVDVATASTIHVAMATPLTASYPSGSDIYPVDPTTIANEYDPAYSVFTLADDAAAGSTAVNIDESAAGDAVSLAAASNIILELGTVGVAEYIRASSIEAAGTSAEVTLTSPLRSDLAAGATITVINVAGIVAAAPGTIPTLMVPANSGDMLVYPDDNATFNTGEWAVIGDTSGTGFEIRRIGQLGVISFDVGVYTDYPAMSNIQRVTMVDDSQDVSVATSASVFDVATLGNLEAGMTVSVEGNVDLATIQSVDGNELTLVSSLTGGAPAVGADVTPTTTLTAAAAAGSSVLALANRVGIEVGMVLRIGNLPNEEYVTVNRITGERGVAPDAGNIVLSSPVNGGYAAAIRVVHQVAPVADAARQATVTVLAANEGSTSVYVTDDSSYVADEVARVITPSGVVTYHRLIADALSINPGTVQLTEVLDFSHNSGIEVMERESLINVQAIDRGAWGDRLQVSVEDLDPSLVQTELNAANGLNPVISLSNYTNLEAGSVLEFFHPDSGNQLGDPAKVVSVDRSAGEVELAAILHADVITAHTSLADNVIVRSREFVINVFLLQRPDPAVPSRNRTVIDSERFVVSMDPRHSRYIHNVIGTTWTAGSENDDDGTPLRLWDQRSEGESNYIRVRDNAAGNNTVLESIRLGPEALVDELDSGQLQAARLSFSEGDDGFDGIINMAQGDNIYLGVNSDEPRLRTGIHALRNIQDISIVAVPGQTTAGVQQALINHCENDRYRFAVLDALWPNRDTLADVQNQRQRFDSKYAALYHPWLTIPQPLPANIANIRQMPIPPSGHMMGIYARTDNSRGVHKTPANEVVRGITSLTRSLNKGEHDLLNPFPVNINVVRDFRENNRGLRVWGARCITSDSEFKYVNVRRLMIFLEASIDRGLQWVVFEPNAEPLWARVRRSITNFLTVVWRNGALEGTKPEQAFFVKCDRTTMTQTDIDNGRLICEIGVAPVKPAEFVIVRIGLWTASAD